MYQYNGAQLTQKTREITPIATTRTDLEITIVLSEVSQKDKYHALSLTCGNINYVIKSTKQTQRPRTDLWLPRGREGGEGMD